MNLPVNYLELTKKERKAVRDRYESIQDGLCQHCKQPLNKPSPYINTKEINPSLYPPGFFKNPVHLHHNHHTGLTIGAVHAYCNAVAWEYFGE